jgi:hypothetical protein
MLRVIRELCVWNMIILSLLWEASRLAHSGSRFQLD